MSFCWVSLIAGMEYEMDCGMECMFEINNLIQGWRQIAIWTSNVHPLTVTGQSEACELVMNCCTQY